MRRPEQGNLSEAAVRPPLWAIALTATLVVAGLRPQRSSTMPTRPNDQSGNSASDEGRGWKDILLRLYQNIFDHRIMALAAGVTFYTLLAIFPAIAALVAIYGLFADPSTLGGRLTSLSGVLPGGAIDVIRDQLTRVASQHGSTLGLTFIISLAVSLWSANAAMKSIFDTLNIVYAEEEKRSFIVLNAISLCFTAAGIAFALVAFGAMIALPPAMKYIGISAFSDLLIRILRWPALFVVIAIAFAVIYRFGPSREKPRWRWISWGSAFAAFGWLVASFLFAWYAQNFGSFNKTYGSLGAVIGFMTWIWLSAIVILIGAEIDAEMEHQTLQDTTTGRPKALGRRRATMADTVGQARSG